MTTVTIEIIDCPTCEGDGRVLYRSSLGVFPLACSRCRGTGEIEHERRVVHDREESRAMIQKWLEAIGFDDH